MVPEPKHRVVSLWKTSPHGERIQGIFFFLGPGWEPLIFVSRVLICQGFSLLMCCFICFIIEMKATPYYESGLDINLHNCDHSGAWVFHRSAYLICVNSRMETVWCNGKLAGLEAGVQAWGQN